MNHEFEWGTRADTANTWTRRLARKMYRRAVGQQCGKNQVTYSLWIPNASTTRSLIHFSSDATDSRKKKGDGTERINKRWQTRRAHGKCITQRRHSVHFPHASDIWQMLRSSSWISPIFWRFLLFTTAGNLHRHYAMIWLKKKKKKKTHVRLFLIYCDRREKENAWLTQFDF